MLAVVVVHSAVIFSMYSHAGDSDAKWLVYTASIILSIATMWVMLAVTAKRFRDCGYSPWYTLTAGIPVAGVFFILVVCGFFLSQGLKNSRLVKRVVS